MGRIKDQETTWALAPVRSFWVAQRFSAASIDQLKEPALAAEVRSLHS